MKATELRDRIDEIVEEFGDCEVYTIDPLEDDWRSKVVQVEFEADRQAITLSDR